MNLSRKWLTEFVDGVSVSDIDDREFSEAMTLSGSKVGHKNKAALQNADKQGILALEIFGYLLAESSNLCFDLVCREEHSFYIVSHLSIVPRKLGFIYCYPDDLISGPCNTSFRNAEAVNGYDAPFIPQHRSGFTLHAAELCLGKQILEAFGTPSAAKPYLIAGLSRRKGYATTNTVVIKV